MIPKYNEAMEWYDIYKRRAKHSINTGSCVITKLNRIYRCSEVYSWGFEESYYVLTEVNTEFEPDVRKVKVFEFEKLIENKRLLYYDSFRPMTYDAIIKQMNGKMLKK
jgi:hypothetical protein